MRAGVVLAAFLATASWVRAEEERPQVLREIGFDQHLGEAVPLDLTFRNEAGEPIRLGTYFGKKPVVLSLNYFACPMLCTVSLNGLASALNIISMSAGKEFEVVTVSFDPKETPELAAAKKKSYLERYKRPGAADGWHFLTGDAPSIAALTKAVGFRYAWDAETRQFAHPAGVLVLTPDGKIARYLYGIEYAPRDLRLAVIEASAGHIGNPVDQIILACYQYDPTTGKYGAAIMRMVRAAGVLTVVALAAFITLMLRREAAAARATTARASHGGTH
jgi:protein SCO1/2